MATGFFILNHKTKPFDDPAIRQVMLHLVSRPDMLQALAVPKGFGMPCHSYFPVRHPLPVQRRYPGSRKSINRTGTHGAEGHILVRKNRGPDP